MKSYNFNNNVINNVINVEEQNSICEWVNRFGKSELSNILPGEVFLVRDLFKGYEWNRISRNDRLLLGTLFINYIKTNNIGDYPDWKNIIEATAL